MDRLEFAVTIAKEAGTFTLDYFDKPDLAIERKGDGTPVTMADKGAERLLRERIERNFRTTPFSGRNFPTGRGRAGSNGSSTRSTGRSRSFTAFRSIRR